MASELVGVDGFQRMMRSAQTGRIPNAVLFTGPAGTGKKTAAHELAMLVNCTGEGEKPCRACKSCRMALDGNHPNFIYLRPEKGRGGIRVEDLREQMAEIGASSAGTGMRVIIAENMTQLNAHCQNALLKTIETPQPDCLYVLISENISDVLPTVLSRSEKVAMHPISAAQVEQVLIKRQIDPKKAALLASVSDGSIGRALALENDEAYWKLRDSAKEALGSLREPLDAFRCAELLPEITGSANRSRELQRRSRLFEIFEMWAHDRMRIDNGLEPGETGEAEFLSALPFSGETFMKQLIRARVQSASNIKWQYLLEVLFLSLF